MATLSPASRRAATTPATSQLPDASPAPGSTARGRAARLPLLFWSLGLLLAAAQVWAAVRADSMNEDGIAYLDLADAWIRGDWSAGVSSVWSPFYSWILGASLAVLRPSGATEFARVHLTNFAIFVFAFGCFELLRREVSAHARRIDSQHRALADHARDALAYLCFLWATLCLITIWAVTPDALMAGFLFVAGALLLRMYREGVRTRTSVGFGLALGAGYLSKAVMFPVGFAFLLAALLVARDRRAALPRVALALVVFLLVCLPWIAVISTASGHITFGDSGRVTYLRHVEGIVSPHWGFEHPGAGTPLHGTRRILDDPPVYEFAQPIAGTYPISDDPAYWLAGAEAKVDLRRQLPALTRNALFYFDLFGRDQGGALACVLLLALSGRAARRARASVRALGLILPVVAALGLYWLVYVEGRYVGAFVVLAWCVLLARLPASRAPAKLRRRIGVVAPLFFAANILAFHGRGAMDLDERIDGARAAAVQPASNRAIADALAQEGIGGGAPVAIVGEGYDAFWARKARVRIVAELPSTRAAAFWTGGDLVRNAVVAAFRKAGARAVIIPAAPDGFSPAGWERIAESASFMMRFPASPE